MKTFIRRTVLILLAPITLFATILAWSSEKDSNQGYIAFFKEIYW